LFAAIMAGAAGLRAQADPLLRPHRLRPEGGRRSVAARTSPAGRAPKRS